jgi:hypothetical protein
MSLLFEKNLNNVEARLVDLAQYAESIVGAAELFDVIVIDGYIHEDYPVPLRAVMH